MPGLIRGVARTAAIAGTATAVSNRVSRRQAGRWAAQAEPEPQYAAPPPPPAPAAPAAPDMEAKLAQLAQLGQLRDSGVLSDTEFEVQKNRILTG
ncbi:SHOCT domain-containing protein [Cellulomonas sp.]|uniref:SHOCT domain-containing protein n=1 Tax=Cellulomonas sp. TaxID=40001 RepID=UPI003BA9A8E3